MAGVKKIENWSDLRQDESNVNLGSDRGRDMIGWSLAELGPGRSILCDAGGTILAGNKTAAIASNHDLPIEVVQTTGDTLVVVQRLDLNLDGNDEERQKARKMAIVDNRSQIVSYVEDAEMLLTHQASGIDLSPMYAEGEIAALMASLMPPDVEFKEYDESVENDVKFTECPSCGHKFPK